MLPEEDRSLESDDPDSPYSSHSIIYPPKIDQIGFQKPPEGFKSHYEQALEEIHKEEDRRIVIPVMSVTSTEGALPVRIPGTDATFPECPAFDEAGRPIPDDDPVESPSPPAIPSTSLTPDTGWDEYGGSASKHYWKRRKHEKRRQEEEMRSRYAREHGMFERTPDLDKVQESVKVAILHARKVCRRGTHLDSSAERAQQFIVSLRRELRYRSQRSNIIQDLCGDSGMWSDAGVLNYVSWHIDRAKQYTQAIEAGMTQANKEKRELDDDVQDLQQLITLESNAIEQMKKLNEEADKLLEGFQQLAADINT